VDIRRYKNLFQTSLLFHKHIYLYFIWALNIRLKQRKPRVNISFLVVISITLPANKLKVIKILSCSWSTRLEEPICTCQSWSSAEVKSIFVSIFLRIDNTLLLLLFYFRSMKYSNYFSFAPSFLDSASISKSIIKHTFF
jgi:hypothetical protein